MEQPKSKKTAKPEPGVYCRIEAVSVPRQGRKYQLVTAELSDNGTVKVLAVGAPTSYSAAIDQMKATLYAQD